MMLGPNHGVQFHLSQTPPSPSGMHRFGQCGTWQGWRLSYAGSLGCCVYTQIHSWDYCGHLDGGGGRLPSICPWAGGLSAWSGRLVQAPACPGVRLSHAAPRMPPHPAPRTDTAEDWGPKLSLWDLFLAWRVLLSTTLIFSPCLNPSPSRTSPTPGMARLQFLEPLNQKSSSLSTSSLQAKLERLRPARRGPPLPGQGPGWEAKPGTPFPRRSVGRGSRVRFGREVAGEPHPSGKQIHAGAGEQGEKDGTHAEKNPSPARPVRSSRRVS